MAKIGRANRPRSNGGTVHEVPMRERQPTREEWGRLDGSAAAHEQLLRACRDAVGTTPEGGLNWLGDFVAKSDAELAKPEAAYELAVFAGYPPESAVLMGRTDLPGLVRVTPPDVLEARDALVDVISGLKRGEVTDLRGPIVDGLYWSYNGAFHFKAMRGNLVAQCLAGLAEILMKLGPALGRCLGCARLFRKARPKQQHCSDTCRVARWRRENHDRNLDAKHASYARKKKSELPGVRVARRKRTKRGL